MGNLEQPIGSMNLLRRLWYEMHRENKTYTPYHSHTQKSVRSQSCPPGVKKIIVDVGMLETDMEKL